jgi:hypothetical protein
MVDEGAMSTSFNRALGLWHLYACRPGALHRRWRCGLTDLLATRACSRPRSGVAIGDATSELVALRFQPAMADK